MSTQRTAESLLAESLSGTKLGLVLGARQVGKATLVEHVTGGRGALFLNFDLEVDKARFLAVAALLPADALRGFGSPPLLVVDEAQRLPEVARIVKEEMAKGRKLFFWDTVIRNALLNAFSADALRPHIGALWENWAIAEVAKRNALLRALPPNSISAAPAPSRRWA